MFLPSLDRAAVVAAESRRRLAFAVNSSYGNSIHQPSFTHAK